MAKKKQTVKKIKENFKIGPKGLNYEEKLETTIKTKHHVFTIKQK